VGAGQEAGDLAGWRARADQADRGRGHLPGPNRQVLGTSRPVQPAAHEQRVARLVSQQVGVGDHADQPPLPDQRQVVDAAVDHGQQHLAQARLGRHGVQRGGHHRRHRRVAAAVGRQHPVAEIRCRHQPGRPSPDHQRGDLLIAHAPGRFGHRLARVAGDQRPVDQLAGAHREQVQGRGLPASSERASQPVAGPTGQQGLEAGLVPQPLDLLGRDQVSQHVLAGDHVPQVGGARQQRQLPERLPLAERFHQLRAATLVGLAELHHPLDDHVQVAGRVAALPQDGGAAGEVGDLHRGRGLLEQLGRQPVERRVGSQKPSDLLHAAQHPRPATRRQAPASLGHPTGSSMTAHNVGGTTGAATPPFPYSTAIDGITGVLGKGPGWPEVLEPVGRPARCYA
jgi:hypothetical protein